ncbi:class A beta-lactamase-related serine hydrolase [Chryseobacterium bernardetii]|nr:class A beta-lactamase-related serine hydrolase [Chryseobacterium bernardetii]
MPFKKLSRSSIILFVFFIFSKTEAQTDSSVSTRELVQSSEDFFNKNLQQNKNIVGISAAIIVNDSVIWSNGFGYADKLNKVPMTTNTVVNMGSITKTFTSLSVMQLQQKGLLNINDPLNSYLRDFRPKTKILT